MPTDRDSPRRTGMLPPSDKLEPRSPSPSVDTEISHSPTRKRKIDDAVDLSSELGNSVGGCSTTFNPRLPGIASDYASLRSFEGDDTGGYLSTAGSVHHGSSARRKKKHRGPEFREKVETLLNAIKDPTVEMNEQWLSNPETFFDLPYPSTTYRPPARFNTFRDKKGIVRFTFMGREFFQELYNAVNDFFNDPEFGGNNRSCIDFNGLTGVGKSHILAALAYLLLRQGKTVIYIPSCEILVRDPIQHFKEFASLAFPNAQDDISTFENKADIIAFLGDRNRGSLVCIADQLDVLDSKPQDSSILRENKAIATEIVNRMRAAHLLIFNLSPDPSKYPVPSTIDSEVYATNTNISLHNGLTETEMAFWWQHYSEEIPIFRSEDDRREVEYSTGRLPLLLRALFKFPGMPYEDIKEELMTTGMLRSVRENATQFAEKKLEELNTNSQTCQAFIQNMKACILESQLSNGSIRNDLVNRYFYFVNNIGHCVCGVVRDAVSAVLLQHFPDFLQGDDWKKVISENKVDNPSLFGFLVEKICLSHIATFGLKCINGRLEAMPMSQFQDVPNFGILDRKGRMSRQLFVPTRFNYDAIDGIIVMLGKTKKTVDLFPIQVTIADDHSDSEQKFFDKWWPKYLKAIREQLGTVYTISITFVWIYKDQEFVTNEVKDVPLKAQGVVNKYKAFKLPVKSIIPDLDVNI